MAVGVVCEGDRHQATVKVTFTDASVKTGANPYNLIQVVNVSRGGAPTNPVMRRHPDPGEDRFQARGRQP